MVQNYTITTQTNYPIYSTTGTTTFTSGQTNFTGTAFYPITTDQTYFWPGVYEQPIQYQPINAQPFAIPNYLTTDWTKLYESYFYYVTGAKPNKLIGSREYLLALKEAIEEALNDEKGCVKFQEDGEIKEIEVGLEKK